MADRSIGAESDRVHSADREGRIKEQHQRHVLNATNGSTASRRQHLHESNRLDDTVTVTVMVNGQWISGYVAREPII